MAWTDDGFTNDKKLEYNMFITFSGGKGQFSLNGGSLSFYLTPVDDSGIIDWTLTDNFVSAMETGLADLATTLEAVSGVSNVSIAKQFRGATYPSNVA